jgi:16S rRNA (guanine527-N7)-methyltransferase
MDASLESHLVRSARALGVVLGDRELALLGRYLDLLQTWNRRINLTAIRDPGEVVEKHFVDSLAILPHLPPTPGRLVDVGSGGGFPGAVVALVRPDLQVTLVESSHKKGAFLSALKREVPVPGIRVETIRLEDLLRRPGFTPFDAAVSRATFPVLDWLDLARPLVRTPGGLVLGMEGAEHPPLPPAAERFPYRLGQADRAIVVLRT